MNNPVLSHEELAAADATCVAQMLDACLSILQNDADQLLALTNFYGNDNCAGITIAIMALDAKIKSMRADMADHLNRVVGNDALASRERTGASIN
jgi:hypothetical protein